MQKMKKVLAILLTLSMVLSYVPVPALAEEGTCPHHVHDGKCGYVEKVEGSPCGHVSCSEACLTKQVVECIHDHEAAGCIYTPAVEPADCDHVHGDCNYVAPQDEVRCTCDPQILHGENCASVLTEGAECSCTPSEVHAEGCAPQPAVAEYCGHTHGNCAFREAKPESWSCGHVCSKESGCIRMECAHVCPGDNCGYVAAAGSDCTYVCKECQKQDCTGEENCPADEHSEGCAKKAAEEKSAADQAAADAVAALIEALPSLEEIQAKPMEEQGADYTQVNAAYDAYGKLTEEQKALLPPAEDVFKPYFDYFSSQTEKVAATSGSCGTGVTWQYSSSTGKLVIKGTGEMWFNNEYNQAPWYDYRDEIKTVEIQSGITHIANSAFSGCTKLTSVTIPDSVTYIGGHAFYNCDSLTCITLPAGITMIYEYTFYWCSNLTEINIPDGVTFIGKNAFAMCTKLTDITIPESVTNIREGAFENCKMTNFTIPSGVKSIHEKTFSRCRNLTSITIPETVTNIAIYAFTGCDSLTDIYYGGWQTQWRKINIDSSNNEYLAGVNIHYTYLCGSGHSYDSNHVCTRCDAIGGSCGDGVTWKLEYTGVLTISGEGAMTDYMEPTDAPWYMYQDKIKTLVVGNDVTTIGSGAFYDCYENLVQINLGNKVESIGVSAFYGCTGITDLVLPDSVTEIGEFAFSRCSNMEAVTWSKNLKVISEGAFEMSGLAEVTLPEGLTTIGKEAFWTCTNLTKVVIPGTVTTLGEFIFDQCSELKEVILPVNLDTIPVQTFSYCDALEAVVIPESVTTIGSRAFYACNNLDTIVIPAGVTTIEEDAFGSSGIEEIYFTGNVPTFGRDVFYEITATVYYPANDTSWTEAVGQQYGGTITWQPYDEENDTESSGTCGTNLTWEYDGATKTLTISGSGTMYDFDSEGDVPWAAYRTAITSVVLPAGLTRIGEMAFASHTALTSIEVPDSVTAIGKNAFSGSGLESVAIPASVTTIGEDAFDCDDLARVDITDLAAWCGIEFATIASNPLYNSQKDSELYLNNVEVTDLVIPDTVTEIKKFAFADCASLQSVTIPATLTKIGEFAFEDCRNISKVYISDLSKWFAIDFTTQASNPLRYGASIYLDESEVDVLTIPDNVTSIGRAALIGSTLEEVIIPGNVTSIGTDAFAFANVSSVKFLGDAPTFDNDSFNQCTTTVYYPKNNNTWDASINQNYGGTITWVAYSPCSGTCGENLTWTFNEATGTLTISGTGAMDPFGAQGSEVWAAPWAAFKNEITAVVVEEGVTSIGHSAFLGYDKIVSVSLPKGLQTIAGKAFYQCAGLKEIVIPDTVTTLDFMAFSECSSLEKADIPGSIKNVGWGSFTRNTALKNVTLGEGIETTGEGVFYECSALEEITIPKSFKYFGAVNFEKCTSLTKIVFLGDPPTGGYPDNKDRAATAYYPAGNSTWTEEWFQNYTGNLIWKPYCSDGVHVYDREVATEEFFASAATCSAKATYYKSCEHGEKGTETFVDGEFAPHTSFNYTDNGDGTHKKQCKQCTFAENESHSYTNGKCICDNQNTPTVTAPTANELIYNGQAQPLVTAGSTIGGTMVYSLTENGEYTESIPMGTNAGEYTVWYYVKGDDNHADSKKQSVEIQIAKAKAEISVATTPITVTYGETVELPDATASFGTVSCDKTAVDLADAGTYTVTYSVAGTDNYDGTTKTVTVTINAKVVNQPVIEGINEKYLHTGNAFTPVPTAVKDGETVIASSEYTLTYDNNIAVGTATVNIVDNEGGNYIVSGSKTFQIEYASSGTCGEDLTWSLAEDGTLTISGEGRMGVILGKEKQPWYSRAEQIKKVVVEEGVTSISQQAFMECPNLEEVVISDTVEEIGALAFYSCESLRNVALPGDLEALEMNLFANCNSLTSLTLPETLKSIGSQVFMGSGLTEITIPGSVESIGGLAFADCENLKKVYFEGDPPAIHIGDEGQAGSFENCTLTAYYPASNEKWTENVMQGYDGEITWESYGNSVMPGNNLYLEDAALSNETTVWIDGIPYPVQKDNSGKAYVELSEGAEVSSMVTYGFHVGDPNDVHTQYPVSMKVWMLKKDENGIYQAHNVKELDNILQYSGSSIRITGNKGIRMITSVESNKKSAMTGAGLAGYKLLEYGTVLAQSSKMTGPLTLGQSYARSNYAYKRGVADPVFAYSGNLVQYTNVLVGFNMDQCAEDIAMRPYMILEDAEGKQVTIYGGTVYRSIGYIAYQNRGVFAPGSAAYNYVWEIIHHVYGDKYDADYKG